MAWDATARRRWFGAAFLFAALAMLIGGETLLKGKLGNVAFIVFWLICFGFTGLALLVAFLDARALRSRIREDQRELLQTTLHKIESEAKDNPSEAGARERPKYSRN